MPLLKMMTAEAVAAVKSKKFMASPARVALFAQVNTLGVDGADQVPRFVTVILFATVRSWPAIFKVVPTATSMFPVIYVISSPRTMVLPDSKFTFTSPPMVTVSIQPAGSTTFVLPGILRIPVVNDSSPWISNVPLFTIGALLSSKVKPKVAKVAPASIVSVPTENSNGSARLTVELLLIVTPLNLSPPLVTVCAVPLSKLTVLVLAVKVPALVQFPSTVNAPVVATNVPPFITIPAVPMSHACAGAPVIASKVHTIPFAVIVCEATKLPEVFVKIPATLSAPLWVSSPPLCSIMPYVTPGPVRVALEAVSYKNLEAASRVNAAPLADKSQVPPDTFVTLPAFIVSVLFAAMVKFCPPVSSESSIATVRSSIVAPPLQIRLSNLPVIVPETVCVAPPSK